MITIYTDGACSKNGSKDAKGGFGVVVVEDDKIIDAYQEFSENTTNNREEIKAILWALENYGLYKDNFQYPVVYSDSMYCVNTFNEWIYNWERNGWKKSNGQAPENLDLLSQFYYSDKMIEIKYIKGHAGNKYNEIADGLATGKYKIKDFIIEAETTEKNEIDEILKPFDISTFKVEENDNILIKIDPDLVKLDDTAYIHKYLSEAFPKNNVITILKGIEIEIEKNI